MTLSKQEEREKRFDEKFCNIDVNECGYDENGEPDNMVICSKDGMQRYGLESVKAHMQSEIDLALAERDREVVEKIEKLQKYTSGSSVEPKDMRVKLTDVINLITNK